MNIKTPPPVIFLTSSTLSRFVCSNVGLLWARRAAVDGATRAAAPELPSVLDLMFLVPEVDRLYSWVDSRSGCDGCYLVG
jgi:hypothetical protein